MSGHERAVSSAGRVTLWVWFGLLIIFLYAPIVSLVVFSFNDSTVLAFPIEGWTTKWYSTFLENRQILLTLQRSAVVAVLSTTGTVVLGTFAAMALVRRRFWGKAGVTALFLSPLVVPYVAFGIALLIFSKAVGLPVGVQTVVIGHVVITFPFALLIIAPRLQQVDRRLEEAARDLGASHVATFRRITAPLIAPAVGVALIVGFIISFDEYAVASFVSGGASTFPIYLVSQLRFPHLLPQVIAVAVVLMIGSLTLIGVAEGGRRLMERRLHLPSSGLIPSPGTQGRDSAPVDDETGR